MHRVDDRDVCRDGEEEADEDIVDIGWSLSSKSYHMIDILMIANYNISYEERSGDAGEEIEETGRSASSRAGACDQVGNRQTHQIE